MCTWMNAVPTDLRSYGRTRGRSLTPARARLFAEGLPRLRVPPGRLDPKALAPETDRVWLEAGFGAGEHLIAQATRRPDVLFLGAEPYLNGLAACVAGVVQVGLANVRLHDGDVRGLIARLPAASVDRLFILFPDPWPKRRHWKRRLIEPAFLAECARILKAGATVRFATDVADYANWALGRFLADGRYRWTAQGRRDWMSAPADHIATRYEQKRLGDSAPVWLEFIRK
jgi:tRNA (guanine-N7-)-methyltransferase